MNTKLTVLSDGEEVSRTLLASLYFLDVGEIVLSYTEEDETILVTIGQCKCFNIVVRKKNCNLQDTFPWKSQNRFK